MSTRVELSLDAALGLARHHDATVKAAVLREAIALVRASDDRRKALISLNELLDATERELKLVHFFTTPRKP